jgi:hypothetical protein
MIHKRNILWGIKKMGRSEIEEFEIFCGQEIKPDDWLWCHKCHRCYRAFEFRRLKEKGKIFLFCHYIDCNGDLPFDSRRWEILIDNKSDLPKEPIKGQTYHL